MSGVDGQPGRVVWALGAYWWLPALAALAGATVGVQASGAGWPWGVVGAAAGVAAGSLAVAGLLAARRPVLTVTDVQAATGLPSLGVARLSGAGPRAGTSPERVTGLAPTVVWVLGPSPEAVVLTSPDRSTAARQRIAAALGVQLMAHRPVQVWAAQPVVDAVRSHVATTARPVPAGESPLTVVDGADPDDLPDLLASSTRTVLVVPWGVPRAALEALGAEANGQLDAVLMYRRALV